MRSNKANRGAVVMGCPSVLLLIISFNMFAIGSVLGGDPTFSIEIVEVNGVDVGPAPVSSIVVQKRDVLTLEFFLRDWSPSGQKLRGYQAQIVSAGYTSGTRGNIFPKDWFTTTDLNGHCSAAGSKGVPNSDNAFIDEHNCFANQSAPPGEPDPVGSDLGPWGILNPCTWYVDCLPGTGICAAPSIDWVHGELPNTNVVINSVECDYRYAEGLASETAGPVSSQDGTKFYAGTVVLKVSTNAAGTFTLCLDNRDDDPNHAGPDYSFLSDENNNPITPVSFECATITID